MPARSDSRPLWRLTGTASQGGSRVGSSALRTEARRRSKKSKAAVLHTNEKEWITVHDTNARQSLRHKFCGVRVLTPDGTREIVNVEYQADEWHAVTDASDIVGQAAQSCRNYKIQQLGKMIKAYNIAAHQVAGTASINQGLSEPPADRPPPRSSALRTSNIKLRVTFAIKYTEGCACPPMPAITSTTPSSAPPVLRAQDLANHHPAAAAGITSLKTRATVQVGQARGWLPACDHRRAAHRRAKCSSSRFIAGRRQGSPSSGLAGRLWNGRMAECAITAGFES